MGSGFEQAKRPVSAALAGPYGHPFHPILVTVPIGAWVCSLVFDIASHIVDDPGFLARASEWLIGIGALGAIAAAMVGFLDLITIPSGTPARRIGLIHTALNLAVIAAYAGNFGWRHTAYPQNGPVDIGPIALSVISILVLGVSGYLGGMLAFRYGVRVVNEVDQADGFRA